MSKCFVQGGFRVSKVSIQQEVTVLIVTNGNFISCASFVLSNQVIAGIIPFVPTWVMMICSVLILVMTSLE